MSIQSPKPFNIASSVLDTSAAPADRFVRMNHFVAYAPEGPAVLLPGYRSTYVGMAAALMPEIVRQTVLKDHKETLDYATAVAAIVAKPSQPGGGLPAAQRSAALQVNREIEALTQQLRRHDQGGENAALLPGLQRIQEASQQLLLSTGPAAGSTGPVAPKRPSLVTPEQQLAMLLSNEIGFLYLDRTRIRPIGFAVGEFLYSLSLAPGEEVTLEQKTYSERQTSLEDLQDQEATLDLELSSTLTGELSQSLNQELSRLAKDSESNAAHVGADIDGVNVSMGPNNSNSVDNGDRITSTTSVKNTYSASTKVAAKYRTQHKITFTVSTVNKFETSSKRVIRNPNAYTPIDLMYFKILKRLRLSQERYGVRLCWAPAIRDPAGPFWARILAMRDALFAAASKASAGPRPVPPDPPAAAPPVVASTVMDANHFDWFNGSQSYDYDVTIAAPAGYVWDGDAAFVSSSVVLAFSGSRPAAAEVRMPSNDGTGMKCIVHVGAVDRLWVDFSTFPPTPHLDATGTASFQVSARFIPSNVQAADDYNQKLAAWKTADDAWQSQDSQIKAAALAKAQSDWDAIRQSELARLNPVYEAFGVVITQMFPSTTRDHIDEIDRWERLFDWSQASLKLYPAWWNGTGLREPSLDPTHFVNASWARLFLPVRVGSEAEAIKAIYQVSQGNAPNAALAKYIDDVTGQLNQYRQTSFGSATEVVITPSSTEGECPTTSQPFVCMGSWEETVPTDGTHIEVLQSTTIAADDDSRQRLDDATALRAQEIERQKVDNALRNTVNAAGAGTVTTSLQMWLMDKSSDPQT
ncbi:hypothetical protein [Bradyrhizobium iriomotense]|uniref:Uncharacterized protein n=1 Tax=Bradyrhizobium iriomotense TaxID=441950 RepID=A0ABQ6AQU9_9BRAD|nr:hypothetical protein [Bradyrhizobium iriomotense]GLR83775.1 hypothetical protein GCM10007857_04850 [Bradyrhizobium iriomotense]